MKTWITTVGSSEFAVINTMWAACELDDFVPEKVYLIYNDKMKHQLESVEKWIKKLTKEYGKEAEIIKESSIEEDFAGYSKLVKNLIKNEKQENNLVAIDATPGRKIMSAFSIFHGLFPGRADKVYYLHLYDMKYSNSSFVEIPANEQNLINIKDMVG